MDQAREPNPASKKDVAEGERWSSDQDSVEDADRDMESMERGASEAGGITNRPLDEENENQEALPRRGESRIEHPGNKDVERDDAGGVNTNEDIQR
jgi:hypothetical protein